MGHIVWELPDYTLGYSLHGGSQNIPQGVIQAIPGHSPDYSSVCVTGGGGLNLGGYTGMTRLPNSLCILLTQPAVYKRSPLCLPKNSGAMRRIFRMPIKTRPFSASEI